jgi:hypothetical protein
VRSVGVVVIDRIKGWRRQCASRNGGVGLCNTDPFGLDVFDGPLSYIYLVPALYVHWFSLPCVGIFHNIRLNGDTSRRYSGKLVATGNKKKNDTPAANVVVFTNTQIGTIAVTKATMQSRMSTRVVRCGTRHS